MRTLVVILLTWIVASANAQVLRPEDQMPYWAVKKWEELAKQQGLAISTRVNPFIWRGDFDGDGRFDLAILVKHSQTNKEGIVLLLRSNRPLLLGAGHTFGNGGDDFSWIDLWYVEDRGTTQRSYYEKSVSLSVDGIIVAKEGSASALVYLERGKAKWQQQGD